MRALMFIASIIGLSLGGLWLLQGLGLVHVEPILCFANCEPVQGPSLSWALAGAVATLLGALGLNRWFTSRP